MKSFSKALYDLIALAKLASSVFIEYVRHDPDFALALPSVQNALPQNIQMTSLLPSGLYLTVSPVRPSRIILSKISTHTHTHTHTLSYLPSLLFLLSMIHYLTCCILYLFFCLP